jgi:glycolate oxidase FAD binding subunit
MVNYLILKFRVTKHDMIIDNDISPALQQQVQDAINSQQPLDIHGGNSKHFYGNVSDQLEHAAKLDCRAHSGIINYEPSELAITLRSGTKLSDLEKLLAENNQMLAFEPPHYPYQEADCATIGGTVAAGISGPRRAYAGSIRDSILGVTMINGEGEIAHFGGEVMKNVAGYDLSRLMTRSMGTLGVILDVSLRVIPKPAHEMTLSFDASQQDALAYFQILRKKQQIISATAWFDQQVYLRLSGSERIVKQHAAKLSGTELGHGKQFWVSLRDHQHAFFNDSGKPLWRLSLPPATPVIQHVDENLLLEWGGEQRWIKSNIPANIIQSIANKHGGYATLFKGDVPGVSCFPALEPALFKLHKQLKNKMDPKGIFSPGRLYKEL